MGTELALDGGQPIRQTMLPYGRQWIDDEDRAAVAGVLGSDWLTTGPKVAELEGAFAAAVGSRDAVAVSSGTAALHAAMYALGVRAGDEVIVPAMTFVASANCAVFQGATPIFADVEPGSLLLAPRAVAAKTTRHTKAIVAVDYAGQPCDYEALRSVGGDAVAIVADACHALGATDGGKPAGSLAALSAFSLHAVKHITSGEGGVVATDDDEYARRVRAFRSHGISGDFRQREAEGSWYYEMTDLGYNYRLTDLQCALAHSQLAKLPHWLARRRAIAARYDVAFADTVGLVPLMRRPGVEHAYHLYVVQLNLDRLRVDRATIFRALRAEGIGVNVHYIPVHLHPFYRERFGTGPGLCPVAEAAYQRIISLPIFPKMTDQDVADVIEAVDKVLGAFAR